MGKNVKNIKSTLLIVGLVIVGIGSFFIYNQQQEKRFLEFEGYEVSIIDKRVNEIYNEDKDDFSQNITAAKFAEINQLIIEVDDKDYGEKNKSRFEEIKNEFKSLEAMYNIELAISDIFEEDNENVKLNIKKDKLTKLEDKLASYKEMAGFYKRNLTRLEVAFEQLNDIEIAQGSIEELFDGEDLHEDVTPEDLEKTIKLINKIKNQELKKSLLAKIDGVKVALLDEDDDEVDEEEEVEVVRESEPEPEQEPEPERDSEREPEPTRPPTPPTPTRPSRPTNPAPPVREEPVPEPIPTRPEPEPEPNPTPEPPKRTDVKTEVVRRDIPFPTKFEFDNNKVGQVITKGVLGYEEVTYEIISYSDGTSTRTKIDQRTVPPVPEIVGRAEPED